MASSSYQAGPPWLELTSDNHAAWIVVATLIFYIYAILSVITKLLIRFNIIGLQPNDYVLLAGTITWTVAVVCLFQACKFGLGQHQSTLETEELIEYSKVSIPKYPSPT